MDKFADFIIRHRRLIIAAFLLLMLVSAVMALTVGVNYNMVDYLPEDAQSTKGLEIIQSEFGSSMPNASVMVNDVSIQQALEYKRSLQAIDGVTEVMWLDDAADIKQPLEMMDKATVEGFYKDGSALYTVTIEEGKETPATNAIWELIGDDNAIDGDAHNTAIMQQATGAEVMNAAFILVPAIIIILVLSSSSWIEPVLILASLAVSIVINMGTNVIFNEVSFITSAVSPILQLAVSLDYAIFLLHSFNNFKKQHGDPEHAMKLAIKESVSTVAASAMTTFFGFLALAFMKFGIGADLGLNLVKGILLSFICAMVFLPALTLSLHRLMDRSQHRPLFPTFQGVNRFFSKLTIPAILIVAVIVVPSFLGQTKTEFIYGNSGIEAPGKRSEAKDRIYDKFGRSTIMVLLVPRGDVSKEYDLGQQLEGMAHVDSVVSYASSVGTAFPADFIGEGVTSQFYSPNYARLIVYTDTDEEGDLAFRTVEEITAAAKEYYNEVYSVGQSANLYDMKQVVAEDNSTVQLIAIISIFIVLLLTFKSATLPFILLLTIETGIWVNLSIPYFMGTHINFIGYLVLSTVQLGATVDYAILLTNTYLGKRRELAQRPAMDAAMGSSFKSILVSASILAIAGFTLFATSSNPGVQDIGLLLGRGTILSFVMVVCFLPAMLRVFDKVIDKTTYKARFLPKPKKGRKEKKHED